MKPIFNKTRKDTHDPLQLDFLSAIPDSTPPMKPIEPSPDGTPPLPLLSQPNAIPPRVTFSFESDPFFNPLKSKDSREPEPALSTEEAFPEAVALSADASPPGLATPTTQEPVSFPPPSTNLYLI